MILYDLISVLRDFHSYKYNELIDEGSKRLSTNLEQDDAEMSQLAENVILDNIGLPIVVAVTKVAKYILMFLFFVNGLLLN